MRGVVGRPRRLWIAVATAVVVVAALVSAVWLVGSGARGGDLEAPAQFTVSASTATQVRAEAGCTVPEQVPRHAPTPHLEQGGDQSSVDLYAGLRPTASGRHVGSRVAPIGVHSAPPDERVTTHNLEHGAVIVWYDRERLSEERASFIAGWAEGWNEAGFGAAADAGGGVIVAPYDGAITSGRPVALRAWNVALDCEHFEVAVGDAFLARHFGTRGEAPERHLVPYPEELLAVVE